MYIYTRADGNSHNSTLNAPITFTEVQNSVYRMKTGKATGLDEIPSEILRIPTCIQLLHRIISYCFENKVSPAAWRTGVITPIPKDGGNPRDPLGYRGITLISIPCKVYADILNVRIQSWLEENNLLAEEQNGFRANRNCVDHIYSLYSVINNRKIKKQSTFICFVDFRKAFDTVDRSCLWYKLMKIGISGRILEAVQSLYDDVTCSVRVNNYLTEAFRVENGVKQGCKLSPTLFSIYLNDLAEDIK